MGSLTGAVASQIVTEAHEGSLHTDGNGMNSVFAEESLTARLTSRAGAKAGESDPATSSWKGGRSTDKSYAGDNRLIAPKRP